MGNKKSLGTENKEVNIKYLRIVAIVTLVLACGAAILTTILKANGVI